MWCSALLLAPLTARGALEPWTELRKYFLFLYYLWTEILKKVLQSVFVSLLHFAWLLWCDLLCLLTYEPAWLVFSIWLSPCFRVLFWFYALRLTWICFLEFDYWMSVLYLFASLRLWAVCFMRISQWSATRSDWRVTGNNIASHFIFCICLDFCWSSTFKCKMWLKCIFHKDLWPI